MLSCEACGKMFKTQGFLNNHLRMKHQLNITKTAVSFHCGECGAQFTKSKNLVRHLRSQHQSANPHRCFFCPQFFAMENSLNDHEQKDHGLNVENVPRKRIANPASIEATTVAINNRFKTHCLKLPKDELSIDPFNYLVSQQTNIMDFIDAELQKVPNMKVGISISVDLVKPLNNDKITAFFNSCLVRIAHSITDEEYLDHVDQLMSKLNVFASCGSGWVIESLKCIEVKTATCQTLNGSSYIETPNILKGLSKSLLNVRNKKDNFCFLYCVAASIFSFIGRAIYPKSHKENVKRLKFNAKRMPMPLSSIAPFEKSNNVSINVYQLDNHKLVAVYYSKNKTSKRRINLLRLVDGSKSHYCLIKNFSNLLQRLTRSEKKRRQGPKSKFCSNCFQPILRKNYRSHAKFCESNSPLEIRMPLSSPIIEFVNWQKTQRVPFVVYADLEAIDVRSDASVKAGLNTKEIERQYPCSFGAILLDERSWF